MSTPVPPAHAAGSTPPALSFLAAAKAEQERAPFLFSDLPEDAKDRLELMKGKGRFTGELLWKSDPDRYRAIVWLLGQGAGPTFIAEALKVSSNTVEAVRQREGVEIEPMKKVTLEKLTRFTFLAIERLVDEVDQIDIDKLPIALGIVVEKMQLLTGGPTTRVEHTSAAPIEDFNRFINDLPAAKVTEMGLAAAESPQRAESTPTRLAPGLALESGQTGPSADMQSAVLEGVSSVKGECGPGCVPKADHEEGALAGGEGGRISGPGGVEQGWVPPNEICEQTPSPEAPQP